MLGPKRDITGRVLPVPKSVPLMSCANAAETERATASAVGKSCDHGNWRQRRMNFKVSGGCMGRFSRYAGYVHRLDNEIGELGRAGFAADVTGQFVAGPINIFQSVANLERRIVLPE